MAEYVNVEIESINGEDITEHISMIEELFIGDSLDVNSTTSITGIMKHNINQDLLCHYTNYEKTSKDVFISVYSISAEDLDVYICKNGKTKLVSASDFTEDLDVKLVLASDYMTRPNKEDVNNFTETYNIEDLIHEISADVSFEYMSTERAKIIAKEAISVFAKIWKRVYELENRCAEK